MVKFSEEELHEARKDFANSLVVKIVGSRGYNQTTFKTVLRDLWNPSSGMKFTEIEGNIMITQFNSVSDRDKVLTRGPSQFMGWALLVEKWTPGKQIVELFSKRIQLWVQIHNLPVEYRQNQFALRFVEKAGSVIHDLDCNDSAAGRDDIRKFIKVKVEIDVYKPFVPGWTLNLGS